MRRLGLLHTVELNDDRALLEPSFIEVRRHPANQDTPPGGGQRRTAELGIGGQRIRVPD